MGTHPIFESDFDCLTESEKMLLKSVLLATAAYGAPVLTFEHKTKAADLPTPAPVEASPETKIIEKPFGKDIVEDYESKDGNYKYHAEMHYMTDSNKDGDFKSSQMSEQFKSSFGSIGGIEQELNKMMENAFNVDSIFGKMKLPTFGSNIFGRFGFENEAIEEFEGSGSTKPLFFF